MIQSDWKVFLKSILSRSHLLPAVGNAHYRFNRLVNREFARREVERERELSLFRREYAGTFRDAQIDSQTSGPRLLVVSSGSLGQLVEIALVKAFQLAGYRPVILLDYDRWVERFYCEVGIRELKWWDEYMPVLTDSRASRLMANVESFQQLLSVEYDGVRVGKYAASTALRVLRTGRPDLSDRATRHSVLAFLRRSVACAKAAKAVFESLRPDLVLSMDLGYSPRGELYDVSLAAGVETVTWNAAHRNNQLIMKRYSRENRDVHPASLSGRTWSRLQARPWTQADRDRLRQEIVGSYTTGEWYSEVGTQFHTSLVEPAAVKATLKLDPAKKTAVIFSHIFWDGTFFYGTDLFDSYEQWFVETVRVACENPAVNWVVKIHPANLVKNVRDGVASEPSELAAIRSLGKPLPPHVQILGPESPISTLSLFSVMDYCVTVRGTVGIEAASFGIPVLTAGTGRYDRLGFTVDSDTRAQFLDRLARIQEIPPPTPHQRALAERFAYGVFVLRPFHLRTVTLEYQRDPRASMQMRINPPGEGGLRNAADLRSLAQWISAGEQDYLSSQDGADAGT